MGQGSVRYFQPRRGHASSFGSMSTGSREVKNYGFSPEMRFMGSHKMRALSISRSETHLAKIIGAIGTSHVPTIGIAYDKGKQQDPAWAPLFEGYRPVAAWLAEKKPDVL